MCCEVTSCLTTMKRIIQFSLYDIRKLSTPTAVDTLFTSLHASHCPVMHYKYYKIAVIINHHT
jgi:hypothetical protein